MKKLTLFTILLFSIQISLANIATDLEEGQDLNTAVQNAVTDCDDADTEESLDLNTAAQNEVTACADKIARVLFKVGVSDIAAVNAMVAADIPLGVAITAVAKAYGVDPSILASKTLPFNLRIGIGDTGDTGDTGDAGDTGASGSTTSGGVGGVGGIGGAGGGNGGTGVSGS